MLAPLLFVVSVTDVKIGILNLLLVPLFFVNTVTNVMIGLLSSNRRYDQCSRFMLLLPTLRSVLSVRGTLLSFNIDIPFKL